MANSVLLDYQGPDWPLGFIAVATPGTVVGIMSLVDPTGKNNPNTPTGPGINALEYSPQVYAVWFSGFKPGGGGMVFNTGNVYIMRKPSTGGAGDRTDTGAMVGVLQPGQTFPLVISPATARGFSPYRYYLDADNAGDGALCTAIGG